ncbi:MAG: molybdenum cofactor guanylyltransferase [Thermodesulfobacteriota bacterium]
MHYPCSGVILAGGLSTRLGGRNKALLDIGGKTILDRLLSLFEGLFEEIILVANDPEHYLDKDFVITADLLDVRSSLTGIHAGLFTATRPYAFFAACDAPFLKREVVEMVLDRIEPGIDVVIPETETGIEPLCAVYSKNCLIPAERNLRRENFQIRRMFKKLRVRTVSPKVLTSRDPQLISFFNINTPEDLDKARRIL